jgi:hypothetical protein
LLEGSNGTRTTDFERDFSKGENDDVPNRYHRVPGDVCGGSV